MNTLPASTGFTPIVSVRPDTVKLQPNLSGSSESIFHTLLPSAESDTLPFSAKVGSHLPSLV